MNGNSADYRFKISVKNAHLYRAIEANGFKSVMELTKKSGINYNAINNLLNLKTSPLSSSGFRWRPVATMLANALNCTEECLFPESVCRKLEKNTAILFSDVNQLSQSDQQFLITGPKNIDSEGMERLDEAMEVLSEREREILNMRFGIDGDELSYREIGVHFGVSAERARQLETKAKRKLQSHISRNNIKFEDFLK